MIIAMRYKTKTVWHLREIGKELAKQLTGKTSIKADQKIISIKYPCGSTITRHETLDKKIFIAHGDFHKLDKQGLCKRCAKRLKNYAKYQILYSECEHKISYFYLKNGFLWNFGFTYKNHTFNKNFYNNFRYLQNFL